MNSMRTRRALVALATVLGIFAFATASPASAGNPASVTGTIIVGSTEFEVGGPPTTDCPSIKDIDLDFDGNNTSGTWTLDAYLKLPFQIPGSTDWFQADVILTDLGDGTYGPWGGSVLAEINLSSLDKEGDCEKTLVCQAAALLIVDPSSSHTGTLPTPTAGDLTNFIGDSTLPGGVPVQLLGSCPVTLTAFLNNQPVYADLFLTW